uniref:ATP-dependent helicase n=1 Tax=Solanum tuberosum TaxID=4113 RepID=M1B5D9_SOLTU
MEPSGGDERNVENNGQRKFSPGTRESFTNQPFVEEVSDDGADSSEEESDGDVVLISEEEEEENGPNVVREEEEEEDEEKKEDEEESDPDVIIREEKEEESDHDVVIIKEEEEDEESDPDVVIIRENEEEDESDPNVVIIREEEEEESDPDVVIIREEEEEEESDPDVVIIREEGEEESDPDVVTIRGCRRRRVILMAAIESKEFTDTTSCSESEFRSSTDALRKNRKKILEESEFLKFIVKSIKNVNDHNKVTPPEKKEHVFVKETLPLILGFEDQEPLPLEKEEWEKEIDNLFVEMNMCIEELHIGFTNPSVSPMQSGQLSDCQMENHHLVLDEQIGLICSVCPYVHLESKYICPPFAQRTRGRYERKYFEESPSLLDVHGFRVSDFYGEGTVWDLVHQIAKATMYFHQCEGFEFMWNNIAGDITLERLREPLFVSKGGCIISHPPGTGKTRLTIVFLQSFLKLFPQCRPVIIAPSNLLLKWEAEFQKWAVDIPFHNLNNKDFSLKEDEGTVGVFNCLSHAVKKNPHLKRMVKLQSWAKSQSVLGISYDLFRILTGEDGEGYAKETREILLKSPGLLVLEEGLNGWNEQSLVWKALRKVETEKRILLSGTPFKNNIKDLYNTLCVVSPKFAADFKQKWTSLSSSIDKNARALEEIRDIISPLVHEFTLCGI